MKRGKRKACHGILCLPADSLGLTAAETIRWTYIETNIFEFEFWSIFLLAAFIKISRKLMFVLRMKRNIPLLGDINPN